MIEKFCILWIPDLLKQTNSLTIKLLSVLKQNIDKNIHT